MIVLVGAPGSGKSTFAETLVKQSLLPWRRVNQVLTTSCCYMLGAVRLHSCCCCLRS
jgi:tRNA uridine 5-carbamoylmethylation protein Kti12